MNFLDEFTVEVEALDIAEDIFKTGGFFAFILTCFSWVSYQKELNLQMQKLATTDPLTGLLNRRAFDDKVMRVLDSELVDVDRTYSMVVIDIDHFKMVNDTHGHSCGDKVIRKVASEIRTNTRKNDLVARYGGEEFIIFLSDTDQVTATTVAEKIRSRVEATYITYDQQTINCTVSLGVSGQYHSLEQTIKRADKALYQAKSKGRNCCVLA